MGDRDQRETINIQAAEDKTRTWPDMDLKQVLKKDLGERDERDVRRRGEGAVARICCW